jgi:hypothetical protein
MKCNFSHLRSWCSSSSIKEMIDSEIFYRCIEILEFSVENTAVSSKTSQMLKNLVTLSININAICFARLPGHIGISSIHCIPDRIYSKFTVCILQCSSSKNVYFSKFRTFVRLIWHSLITKRVIKRKKRKHSNVMYSIPGYEYVSWY